MNDTRAHKGLSSKTSGRRPLEDTTPSRLGELQERSPQAAHVATWARVDRELDVRSRLVVALDAIEDGDVRMAELCLFQLLDDLDGALEIVRAA
jgi:hypothetical protein